MTPETALSNEALLMQTLSGVLEVLETNPSPIALRILIESEPATSPDQADRFARILLGRATNKFSTKDERSQLLKSFENLVKRVYETNFADKFHAAMSSYLKKYVGEDAKLLKELPTEAAPYAYYIVQILDAHSRREPFAPVYFPNRAAVGHPAARSAPRLRNERR